MSLKGPSANFSVQDDLLQESLGHMMSRKQWAVILGFSQRDG